MRKILCVAKQEKKESEKRGVPKNVIKDIFCDPEDVSRKTDDSLSAFEKTDTYKSMSAEFKFQLKSLMGYEYESESDAKEGIMQLLRCFESQKESNLEIKVSTKEGYTVFISDNRKNRKIPNTYTGKLSFKISEKISVSTFRRSTVFSICMLSFFLSILVMKIFGFNIEEQKPTINDIPYYVFIFMTAFIVLAFIHYGCGIAFSRLKKFYSFECNFSLVLMLAVFAFEFYFCPSERIIIGCVIVLFVPAFCIINIQNGMSFDKVVEDILTVAAAPITKTIGSLLFKIKE